MEIYDAETGGTLQTGDDLHWQTAADMPASRWVQGIEASGGPHDVELTLSCSLAPETLMDSVNFTVLSLRILRGGTDITDTTQEEIAGKRVILDGVVEPADAAVQDRQWTVPGLAIADYQWSYTQPPPPAPGDPLPPPITSATVVDLAALQGQAVDFYWLDGSFEGTNRVVVHSASVEGLGLTASVTFSVKRPNSTMATTTDQVYLNEWPPPGQPDFGMRFGQTSGAQTPGIAFNCSISVPPGFSGDTAFAQVYSMMHRLRLSTLLHPWQRKAVVGIDDAGVGPYPWLYSGDDTYADDTPALIFPSEGGVDRAEVSDSATMYYMFRPTGPADQTIWVPLRKVYWSWGGAAHLGEVWVLDYGSNSHNPPSWETASPPTWDRSWKSGEWVAE